MGSFNAIGAPNPPLVMAHNVLQIVGFVLCSVVLITAIVSKRIRRSPMWYLFMSSWLLWCIIFFLLAGQQFGKKPSKVLCTIQAVLVYSIAPTCCWATLCISVEVLLLLHAAVRQRQWKYQHWTPLITFMVPILIFIFAFIEQLVIAIAKPDSIARQASGAFCFQGQRTARFIMYGLILLALVAVVVVKFATIYLVYKTWRTLGNHPASNHTRLNPLSRGLVIRMIVFSSIPVLILIIIIIEMRDMEQDSTPISTIMQDCLPIAAAFTLGTQTDILRVWLSPFRREGTSSVADSEKSDSDMLPNSMA